MLGNFSGDEVTVTLPEWQDAETIIGAPGFTLGPWEGKAYIIAR